MAEVETNLIRQETMTTLVMDKSYNLQDKSPTYPEVQLRQKNPDNSSETQRKKRAKNRLSNRRSTGFVFEDEVKAAKDMGPGGDVSGAKKQ